MYNNIVEEKKKREEKLLFKLTSELSRKIKWKSKYNVRKWAQ
jgi:hypothetical protein